MKKIILDGETLSLEDVVIVATDTSVEVSISTKAWEKVRRAEKAVKEKIAQPLGLDLIRAAYGIYQVINTNMAQGVRMASMSSKPDRKELQPISNTPIVLPPIPTSSRTSAITRVVRGS